LVDRKASVSLELKATAFKAEATAAEAKVDALDRKVDKLDRSITKIPPDAAKAAAAMKLMGDDAGRSALKLEDLGKSSTSMGLIDQRIMHTRGELKRLSEEFDRTGNVSVLQKLFKSGDELKDLEGLRKRLVSWAGDAGQQGGQSFFKSFAASFEGAGQYMIPGLIAAGIAVSPLIGAAINAALLSGVGLGGVALGIVGQIHDPRVQAAAGDFAHRFGAELRHDTAAFADPIIAGLATIGDALRRALSSTDFAGLAQTVGPLARGIAGLVEEMGPGMSEALRAARPLLIELAHLLPGIGQALTFMFHQMAASAEGTREGLRTLIFLIMGILGAIGLLLRVLATGYEWFIKIGTAASDAARKLGDWVLVIPVIGQVVWLLGKTHEAFAAIGADDKGVDQLGRSLRGTSDAVSGLTREVDNQKRAVDGLTSAWDKWFGVSIGVDQATLQYNQDLTRLSESIQQNRRHWELNTKAGQDNYGALLQAIQGAHDLRQAQIDSGISSDQANRTYQQSIDLLLAMAAKAGLSASQVQSLRSQVGGLRDSLASLPPAVATPVTAPGLDAAASRANSFRDTLDNLANRRIQTYIDVNIRNITSSATYGHGSQGLAGALNRWGGIYQHAAEGLLSAKVYSPMGPARYAFAEPGTGGEAFVPRFGDYARSMGILDQAARWYGARVTPGGGGAIAVTVQVSSRGVAPFDRALSAAVHEGLRTGKIKIFASMVRS